MKSQHIGTTTTLSTSIAAHFRVYTYIDDEPATSHVRPLTKIITRIFAKIRAQKKVFYHLLMSAQFTVAFISIRFLPLVSCIKYDAAIIAQKFI
jgi:hypothetical protein